MLQRMKPLSFLVAGALLALGAPAQACLSSAHTLAIVQSAPPEWVPQSHVVAEVELENEDMAALRGPGIRARIVRLIQGDVEGTHLIVRSRAGTSCDRPFANGTSGIVSGPVRAIEDGQAVIEARRVARRNGFRIVAPGRRR